MLSLSTLKMKSLLQNCNYVKLSPSTICTFEFLILFWSSFCQTVIWIGSGNKWHQGWSWFRKWMERCFSLPKDISCDFCTNQQRLYHNSQQTFWSHGSVLFRKNLWTVLLRTENTTCGWSFTRVHEHMRTAILLLFLVVYSFTSNTCGQEERQKTTEDTPDKRSKHHQN